MPLQGAGKELWYTTVVTDREMNFEEFVDHISSHNSPYSRGTVHGVMLDMLDGLKELILEGKSVRLGGLGLFSIGMKSHGELTKDKVSAASVEDIHLIVRNTRSWSNSELKKLCKITAYDSYGAEGADGDGTNPGGGNAGGDTNQGSSGTQGGGTSGGISGGTGSENMGQGGGSDPGTTGGGSGSTDDNEHITL